MPLGFTWGGFIYQRESSCNLIFGKSLDFYFFHKKFSIIEKKTGDPSHICGQKKKKNPKTVVILFIYLFLGWVSGTFSMLTIPRRRELTKMKVKSFSALRIVW